MQNPDPRQVLATAVYLHVFCYSDQVSSGNLHRKVLDKACHTILLLTGCQ